MMARVIATYPDGLAVAFNDGDVSGDSVLIDGLRAQTGFVEVYPEGPTALAAGYALDPYIFMAACEKLRAPQMPMFETTGVEEIPEIPPPVGTL